METEKTKTEKPKWLDVVVVICLCYVLVQCREPITGILNVLQAHLYPVIQYVELLR